jgi:hypothetical protein
MFHCISLQGIDDFLIWLANFLRLVFFLGHDPFSIYHAKSLWIEILLWFKLDNFSNLSFLIAKQKNGEKRFFRGK